MKGNNLLLIIPELGVGGAQRSISKLSLELSKVYNVTILVFNCSISATYPFGGDLRSLEVYPGEGIANKVSAFFKRVNATRKIKKELQIDCAISFLEGADYVNVLSRNGERIILSVRGSKLHDEIMHQRFWWMRTKLLIPLLYKRADAIVTVNHGIANELRESFSIKAPIITIPNFYDVNEMRLQARMTKTTSLDRLYTDPVLVYIGRLAPEKGLSWLLMIFTGLKKLFRELRFVFVGIGPEYNKLLDLCHAQNLKVAGSEDFLEIPDVVFTGSQANVFKYLKGASLCVMNSSSEGFPNALVEAMICGVPVVSSNCPYGPAEILAPGKPENDLRSGPYFSEYGILMPIAASPQDVSIWVSVISQVLNDQALRRTISEAALVRANSFDKEMIINKWLDIIS